MKKKKINKYENVHVLLAYIGHIIFGNQKMFLCHINELTAKLK